MVVKVLDLARKRAVTFLELSYGSTPTFSRYTDADSDTVFETNTYLSRPTLSVKMPPYTGMLEEKPLKIVLQKDAFIDALSSGQAHAPVTVRVVVLLESDTPGTPSNDIQELFRGVVAITVRNTGKKLDQVALKCINWKHETDRPSGIQANAQCFFLFQGRGCVVDSPPGSNTFISTVTPILPATRTVTVLTIVGTTLTLTAPPPNGPFTSKVFHRGFFELDGLKIGIREWSDTGNQAAFLLEKPAPSSWAGAALTLHQGCDKSILTCKNRYSNDAFFGGFGAAIRDYNPIFETRD